MHHSKIMFWVLAIAMLGTYSHGVLTAGLKGPAFAYAETIENNPELSQGRYFVEVAINDRYQNAIQRVIDRFKLKADEERALCMLTEEEARELNESVEMHWQDLELSGGETAQVLVPESGITEDEIKLRNPDSHCIRLSVYERIILMLSSRIS